MPVGRGPVGESAEAGPERELVVAAPGTCGPEAFEDLAVDIELRLPTGCVADPYRARAAIPLQPVELLLFVVGATVDVVHHLELAAAADAGADPVEEGVSLLAAAERVPRK